MDGEFKQRGNLKKNGNKKATYKQNLKELNFLEHVISWAWHGISNAKITGRVIEPKIFLCSSIKDKKLNIT